VLMYLEVHGFCREISTPFVQQYKEKEKWTL